MINSRFYATSIRVPRLIPHVDPRFGHHVIVSEIAVSASRSSGKSAALAAVIERWKLQPVLLGGQPTPVCALVWHDYPAGAAPAKSKPMLPSPVPPGYESAIIVGPSHRTAAPRGALDHDRVDGPCQVPDVIVRDDDSGTKPGGEAAGTRGRAAAAGGRAVGSDGWWGCR